MKTVLLTKESAKEYAGGNRALARLLGLNLNAINGFIKVEKWCLMLDQSNNVTGLMDYPDFHIAEGYEEPDVYIRGKNKLRAVKVEK